MYLPNKISRLLVFLVLIASVAHAQTPVTRNNGVIIAIDYDQWVKNALKIPVFIDTTHALTNSGIDSIGLIFKQYGSSKIWVRDSNLVAGGHIWTLVGTGGGAGISYPNTAGKYLNGYGGFPALNTDSIPPGTTNKYFVGSDTNNLKLRIDTIGAKAFGLNLDSLGTVGYPVVTRINDSTLGVTLLKDSAATAFHLSLHLDGSITGYIDTSVLHSGTYNDGRYRTILDTVYAHLLMTRSWGYKISDSLSLLIAQKLTIGDTSYAHFLMTRAWGYKISDSIFTVINAALATKVGNLGASTSIKTGLYSSRPTASNCLCYYIATDSAKIYYDNGSWITIGGGGSGGGVTVANPSGLIGMTAVNGTASTAPRSDGHSAIDPAIVPTWTQPHTFNRSPVMASLPVGSRVMIDPVADTLVTQAEILHSPALLATAAALPSNTYSNGTAGVGATLTATSNAALTVDGVAVISGNRILVKNEAAASNNGIYTVTQAGSGSLPYILTRGGYSSIAANTVAGSRVFIQSGTVNSNTEWYQQTTGTITFGTTNLVYSQVAVNVPIFTATVKGEVPAPGTVSGRVLQDDQAWHIQAFSIPTVGLGTLYSKSSFSSTSDFTALGSFGFTTTSGELIFASGTYLAVSTAIGTSNTVNQVAKITAYGGGAGSGTILERWKIGVGGKLKQAPSSTFGGPGIGLYSINAAGASKPNTTIQLNTSTNTGSGQLVIMAGVNNITVAVSTGALILSASDSFTISAERVQDVIYAVARDITNGGIVQCSYRYDPSSSLGILMPNTSNFAITTFGANAGGFSIDTVNITSLERKAANIAFLDDSKGRYAISWDLSACALLNRLFTNSINEGGEADCTQDALNHLPEFIATAPSTAIVCVGRNDSSVGVSNATRNANLDTIVARLQRAGIQVWILDGIFETLVNQTVYAAYIRSTFPNNFIPTLEAGTPYGASIVSPDNIHPNYSGAQVEVAAIKDFLTNNGKYVDGVFDGIRTQSSFDQINMFGPMLDVYANYPVPYGPHDISLRDGAAIWGAYGGSGSTLQFGRITLCNTTTPYMLFDNTTGGAQGAGGGFVYRTPNGLTSGAGNLAESFRIGNAGIITTKGATLGFSAVTGDIYGPRGSFKLGGAATSGAGNESYFEPQDASNNINIVNATKTGYINFYNANGASGGSLVKQVIIDSLGYFGVHQQTFYHLGIIQAEHTTVPQLALVYNSTHFATLQVNSSSNLDIEGLSGLTINSGALPTGTTTDSVLVETTSSNVATVKKVAQSSIGGTLSPVVFSSTASGTAVTNTTTTTSITGTGIGSKTIAANALTVGESFTMHGWLIFSTGSSNTQITIYFQTSTGGLGIPITLPASATNQTAEVTITGTILTTGSSGTVGVMGILNIPGISQQLQCSGYGGQAINTTVSQTFDVTAGWTTASTSNSINMTPLFTLKLQ